MRARVLDERSPVSLRRLIGRLLLESDDVAIALARIRLAALDLTADEIARPARCRVLLGQLDAATLADASGDLTGADGSAGSTVTGSEAARAVALAGNLRRLQAWLESGRLEVRSAGIGAWTPDFSVYERPRGGLALLGAHYFINPQLTVGPSVTVVVRSHASVRLLTERFEQLWRGAHDVGPAIADVLDRSLGEVAGGYVPA